MVFLYHIDHIADETLEGFADHSNKCMTTSLQPDRNVGSSSFMLAAVFRSVPVLVEGVRTNFFRLGCPVYCAQLFPPPGPGHWRSSWILLLSPPSLDFLDTPSSRPVIFCHLVSTIYLHESLKVLSAGYLNEIE